jgi:hypothetical protein
MKSENLVMPYTSVPLRALTAALSLSTSLSPFLNASNLFFTSKKYFDGSCECGVQGAGRRIPKMNENENENEIGRREVKVRSTYVAGVRDTEILKKRL